MKKIIFILISLFSFIFIKNVIGFFCLLRISYLVEIVIICINKNVLDKVRQI